MDKHVDLLEDVFGPAELQEESVEAFKNREALWGEDVLERPREGVFEFYAFKGFRWAYSGGGLGF